MSNLEQELRDKIKSARKDQYEEEDKAADLSDLSAEPVEPVEAAEPAEPVESIPEETKEPEAEPELEDDLEELDTKSDEFKKLAPDAKKFYHMRKDAKEKSKELQEMKERLARMEGAQQAQQAIQQPPAEEKAPVEEIPDKDLDPDAYLDYHLRKKDKEIEDIKQRFDNFENQAAASSSEQLYKELESRHAEKDTSYKDAKAYLVQTLHDEIKQAYPAASESQIRQHLKTKEYDLVASLAKAGWNQGAIFGSIKAQAIDKGYKETESKPKADKTKLKRNMEKSASLNDAPSAAADVGFSANQLNKMNIVDIAQLTNDSAKFKKAQIAIKRARIKAMS